jgi:anaerobic magnesium-protoporphyrin IX monomethyl ester cyclase
VARDLVNVLVLNPPRLDGVVMVKEGRCMQREGAWGYVMAPVTMVTVATLLRDEGHAVRVLDCPAIAWSVDEIVAAAGSFAPDVVLVNTSTPTIADDVAVATRLRAALSSRPVIALYGIHPSCRYEDLLAPGGAVDCCVIGEPEVTARDLVRAVADGEGPSAVEGIAWLDGERLVVNAARAPLADLDELPIPDWSFVDTSRYRLPLNDERFLLVNTNRGCPYRCTFCNAHVYYGRRPRRRSVAHVMRELTNDVERFGVTNFMIWAEEFILDKPFVLELCDAIRASGLPVRWVCNSRVDAVDAEVLSAIGAAGCWNIAYGIESGNQHVLDALRKQTTLGMVRQAVSLARDAGLQVTGHVILGFPEDTRETMNVTEAFVDSLDLDFVQYYCAMPYPGTELYDRALQNGWLTTGDWEQWEHNRSVLTYDHLSAAEIMATRRAMLRRYYFDPRRVIRTLRNHVQRPAHLLALLSRVRGFLRWM